MRSDRLVLRGYAAPYNSVAVADDIRETIRPRAFDQMLQDRAPVVLQYASHDVDARAVATTVDGSLELFVDEIGLGFEAHLNPSPANWAVTRGIVQGRYSFASVNFTGVESEVVSTHGCVTRIIRSATIDHIAIMNESAAYKETSVWRADCPIDEAPMRIRAAVERWDAGHRAAAEARTRAVAKVSAGRRSTPTTQQALSTQLQPRMAAYAETRSRFFADFLRGGHRSATFGHAAFSRAAGWNGSLVAKRSK